jgi:hypothetical protein
MLSFMMIVVSGIVSRVAKGLVSATGSYQGTASVVAKPSNLRFQL